MNEEILKRFKVYSDEESIRKFFELAKLLINELNLNPDDKRFDIGVPIKNERISFNINGRLVLALEKEDAGASFLLMINKEDESEIKKQFKILYKVDFSGGNVKAELIKISKEELIEKDNSALVNLWIKSCKSYLPLQTATPYRRHHLTEMYEMAKNIDLLNEYLTLAGRKIIPEFGILARLAWNSYSWSAPSSKEDKIEIERMGLNGDHECLTFGFKSLPLEKENKYVGYVESISRGYSVQKVENTKIVLLWSQSIKDNKRLIVGCYGFPEFGMYKRLAKHKFFKDYRGGQIQSDIDDIILFENPLEIEPKEVITKGYLDKELMQRVTSYNYLSSKNVFNILSDILLKNPNDNKLIRLIEKLKNIALPNTIKSTDMKENTISSSETALNTILYGPPGTGKTYNTINQALSIIERKTLIELSKEDRKKLKERFEKYVGIGQIVFTTFHQSMSYEDFVEGIKPETTINLDYNNIVTYEIKSGIFKSVCDLASQKSESISFDKAYQQYVEDVIEKGTLELKTLSQSKKFIIRINSNRNSVVTADTEIATKMVVTKEVLRKYVIENVIDDWKSYTPAIGNYLKEKYKIEITSLENAKKNFVLIIDEINRGNVSQIFGELITLIEDDKRLGKREELKVTLPYSKKEFGVPPNLYIIGTMNTADRSVEALDTALRRRFSFVEMPPKPELLKNTEIDLQNILRTINKRIEKLLDKDHLIGHSYFMNVNSWSELQEAFANKILPLMQEYFYGDYARIGLILGKDFFEQPEQNQEVDSKFFAEFNHDAIDDLKTRSVWKLKNVSAMELKDFEKAINTLLRK